jgi:hypothetical protein
VALGKIIMVVSNAKITEILDAKESNETSIKSSLIFSRIIRRIHRCLTVIQLLVT